MDEKKRDELEQDVETAPELNQSAPETEGSLEPGEREAVPETEDIPEPGEREAVPETEDIPESGEREAVPEAEGIPESGGTEAAAEREPEPEKDLVKVVKGREKNSRPEKGTQKSTQKETKKAAGKSAVIEELVSWIKSFAIMFCVALFLTQFIIINAVIPSGSMENTIMTHDRLIGARFSYWFSEPERGDIVIFHYPVDEKRIYIKRIIGLPGETVRIEDGGIYINDASEPLQEGYLKEDWEVLNTGFTFEVPEGCYLMLGDNRNWSEDARYWADNALDEGLAGTREEAEQYSYVRKDRILGKAIFTYFRRFRILEHGGWYEEE